MDQDEVLGAPQADVGNQGMTPGVKKQWQQPKLVFVAPTLTKHGDLTEVTGQFFGGFSPAA